MQIIFFIFIIPWQDGKPANALENRHKQDRGRIFQVYPGTSITHQLRSGRHKSDDVTYVQPSGIILATAAMTFSLVRVKLFLTSATTATDESGSRLASCVSTIGVMVRLMSSSVAGQT